MTKVAQLAEQFGKGKATAQQVADALVLQGGRPSGDLVTQDTLGEDPDFPSGDNDWTDVENVYYAGGLTDSQFVQLFRAAFPHADTSAKEG